MAGLTSFLAAAFLAAAPPQTAAQGGEPLPAGAPTDPYQLTAWCYGAMSEYLEIYSRIKPDLRAIDKMFGSSKPNEPEPYGDDMRAARVELKVLADAVQNAEKASPRAIAPEGVEAIRVGRAVWAPAEGKTSRELARAWLSWAMPDRCDSTARALGTNAALLGAALKYNDSGGGVPSAAPPSAAGAEPGRRQSGPTDTLAAPANALPSPSAPAVASPAAPTVSPDPNGPIPDPVIPHAGS